MKQKKPTVVEKWKIDGTANGEPFSENIKLIPDYSMSSRCFFMDDRCRRSFSKEYAGTKWSSECISSFLYRAVTF